MWLLLCLNQVLVHYVNARIDTCKNRNRIEETLVVQNILMESKHLSLLNQLSHGTQAFQQKPIKFSPLTL